MQVNKDNYLQIAEEKKKQLLDYARNEDGWKLEKTKDDVQIYRGKTDDSSHLVRGVGVVPGTIESILAQIADIPGTAKLLDPAVSTAKIIEKIGDRHQFVYQQNKMPTPVSTRDWAIFQAQEVVSKDLGIYVATSCVHPEAPVDKKYVRGEIQLAGYVIEPVDEKQCKITYVIRVDLKGMVPGFAVAMAAIDQGLVVRNLRKIMEKLV